MGDLITESVALHPGLLPILRAFEEYLDIVGDAADRSSFPESIIETSVNNWFFGSRFKRRIVPKYFVTKNEQSILDLEQAQIDKRREQRKNPKGGQRVIGPRPRPKKLQPPTR